MFWRKRLYSSGDHMYEVTKCFRFDSQRIVKGVRWGDHCWRLLHVDGFPVCVFCFLKPQFIPPWCRKTEPFEILYKIIQYSFHCLISLAFPHFHLKKLLSIGFFTKIWRFFFVTFGPCYINNIRIFKNWLTTMMAIRHNYFDIENQISELKKYFVVFKHHHCWIIKLKAVS